MAELVQAEATLESLTAEAIHQHDEVGQCLTGALEHAILAGEALLQARTLVPNGAWGKWVEGNIPFAPSAAQLYVRLATYKDKLPSDVSTIAAARPYLFALPPATSGRDVHNKKATPEMEAEAKRLLREGLSYRQIGQLLGMTDATVAAMVDPAIKRKQRESWNRSVKRRQAAKRALEREERDKFVKATGGDESEIYSFIRRALAKLDRIEPDAVPNVRRHLREAEKHLQKAEDEIVRALREERGLHGVERKGPRISA